MCIDFWPCRIAGECDEQIGPSIVPHICHGILCVLMHVSGAASYSGRQDPHFFQVIWIGIIGNCIPEVNVLL
jgi:hypothetical protein